jgi:hypothetical protein|tara:strand:+ start:289 stop:573 length:285 start_codon:yes stop_codon:yes gene_type:complete
MIVEAILSFLTAAVNFVLALLPTWDPLDLSGLWATLDSGPGQTLFGFFAWANYYLPFTEALSIATLSLSIWVGVHLVRFIIWLLQLFHIAGGNS